MVAMTVANVNRGRGKPAYTATDFMPYQQAEDRAIAADKMANARRMQAALRRFTRSAK